jgi:hypothetical protein
MSHERENAQPALRPTGRHERNKTMRLPEITESRKNAIERAGLIAVVIIQAVAVVALLATD